MFIQVERPEIIKHYKSIRGVDKHDKLVSYYRVFMKSSKWTFLQNGVLELSECHTSVNISEWFECLLDQWSIKKDKVVTVVTDSGANILSAVKTTFGHDKHLPCFAHTLDLVSQRALDNLPDILHIINKMKSIVTFFKQSITASDELRKLCNFKLKQSVRPTRNNLTNPLEFNFLHDWSILIVFKSYSFSVNKYLSCPHNIVSKWDRCD